MYNPEANTSLEQVAQHQVAVSMDRRHLAVVLGIVEMGSLLSASTFYNVNYGRCWISCCEGDSGDDFSV